MILQIASLYDKKAQVFKAPLFVTRMEVATRALSGAVAGDQHNEIAQHVEDFAMYFLGTFNDETGQFIQPKVPTHICEAAAFKKVTTLKKGNLDV